MSAENVREFYRQQGIEAERERIIALLEDRASTFNHCNCEGCAYTAGDIEWNIALIKGEQK